VARSCARRWYIFLPLLLVTAWFSHSAYSSAKPVYYSQAVIGLAPPSSRVENVPQGEPVSRNALLDIGGAPLVANMVAMKLKESVVVDNVVAGGGLSDYAARMFPVPASSPPMPMILIESSNGDPAAVTKTLELVLRQADGALHDIQAQAQVPTNLMVAPFVVSPPSAPSAGMPSRTRSTVAIFVAGFGLSVLMTVLADILLTRLRSRSQRRRQAHPDSAAEWGSTHSPNGHERPNDGALMPNPVAVQGETPPTHKHHPPDDATRVPEGAIDR
jgi:hypothetical protein